MASTFLRDVYFQFTSLRAPQNDLTGKISIVTGSNTGLGLETARTLARLNAKKVILAVRSVEKGLRAKDDIEQSTNRQDVIEVWHLDLMSFTSVLEFANRAQKLGRLDIVIENAAINAMSFREAEGHESSVTVNVLSTFLLALNLLPKLYETARKFKTAPNLVILSSAVHSFTSFPQSSKADIYAALDDQANFDVMDRYNVTKLMDVLLTRELAERVRNSNQDEARVVINTVDPGICKTDLTREFTGLNSWLASGFTAVLGRTAEVGSRTVVFAATAELESHGKYIGSCRILNPSAFVQSEKGGLVQKALWKQTMQQLAMVQPDVESKLQL